MPGRGEALPYPCAGVLQHTADLCRTVTQAQHRTTSSCSDFRKTGRRSQQGHDMTTKTFKVLAMATAIAVSGSSTIQAQATDMEA